MDTPALHSELKKLIGEFGERPYGFFTILCQSATSNIDLATQNAKWAFVKAEAWHSLDLSTYVLWSVADNGDLLWWNGHQTIAMDHRGSSFVSEPVSPSQFIRLAGLGKIGSILPNLSARAKA